MQQTAYKRGVTGGHRRAVDSCEALVVIFLRIQMSPIKLEASSQNAPGMGVAEVSMMLESVLLARTVLEGALLSSSLINTM